MSHVAPPLETPFAVGHRPRARRAGRSAASDGRVSHVQVHLGRLASIALAAILILLALFALGGAFATNRATRAATHASTLSTLYDGARFAVVAEESLERKYRLEPGPAVRAAHQVAAADLVGTLAEVRRVGEPADRALVDAVLTAHVDYLDATGRLFAAVDDGDTARATEIDNDAVDPVFGAIQERVERASAAHKATALGRLVALRSTERIVFLTTPIAFAIGMILLAICWLLLRQYQHRAEAATRLAAEREVRRVQEAAEIEQRALRASEGRLRALVTHATGVIIVIDATGALRYESPAAGRGLGFPPGEYTSAAMLSLIHADDVAAFRRLYAEVRGEPDATRTIEVRLRHKDGAWRHFEVVVSNRLADPNISGIVLNARDITERKETEAQLIHNALHDTLTGLPNRALLLDRLQQSLARTARRDDYRFAVLYLDLDRFKTVNDSLGHTLGDDLLRQAGSRLAAAIGPGGTIARLGGDEFVILTEDIAGIGDVLRLAERLRNALHAPIVLEERELFVTASIGIALGTSAYRRPEDLLRDADTAMYHAKTAGKDRHVVFAPEMHARAVTRLEMETDLRGAVERGEMLVVYQPIIALATGEVEGFEALLRWDHPRLGAIPPAAFIPVAEETGMIVALDRWALRTACRQVRAWQEARPKRADLTLSVNLSGRQIAEEDLAAVVLATLADTGLPAECLNLEITESALIAHADAAEMVLAELRAAGIGIHLDDFGVGYSSLNYLRRFPIDMLKIDRSFVMGEGALAKNEDVLRGIVGLAQGMRMRVVAEGIETAEQIVYLRTLGCDAGQGYYFACPLDAREAASLLGESVPA